PRCRPRRRLATAGHLPGSPARADRRRARAPPPGARRRADRDRSEQRVALRRTPVVRPRPEFARGLGRGAGGVAPRAARARGVPLRRPVPLALVRRADRAGRRVRGRGDAAPAEVTMLLADRIVLVSGIGPGLGAEIALGCAREGANVVLAARSAGM